MKQKGLNDIIKIGKFEIIFYNNTIQLEHDMSVGDFYRCYTKQGISEILNEIELSQNKNDGSEIESEWQFQKDKIVSELCKLQKSNKIYFFRIYYNYKA